MGTAVALAVVIAIIVVIPGYLIGAMVRSIRDEKRSSRLTKTWRHFGLSLGFCLLFALTWLGQAVAEWQVFRGEQEEHGRTAELGDFINAFGQSTLENWQSEFLQLFSFVVMSALLIHRGSAESKDGQERMEEMLRRIEAALEERAPSSGGV
jgi:hypothetical protein